MNIRQFDDLRYIEAFSHFISFTARLERLEKGQQEELDKQMRICIEIYLSKIKNLG